jgi:hypothetical protein
VPWQLAEAQKAGDANAATIEHLKRRLLTVTAQYKDLSDKVGHQWLPLSLLGTAAASSSLRVGERKICVYADVPICVCDMCRVVAGVHGCGPSRHCGATGASHQRSHSAVTPATGIRVSDACVFFVDVMVRRCPLPRAREHLPALFARGRKGNLSFPERNSRVLAYSKE